MMDPFKYFLAPLNTLERFRGALEFLGHPSEEVRDGLAFEKIDDAIHSEEFKTEWTSPLLKDLVTSSYLHHKDPHRRSFSLLIICSLVVRDFDFLIIDLGQLITNMKSFVAAEANWPYHSKEAGLIHMLSHFCDLCGATASHPSAKREDQELILSLVKNTLESAKDVHPEEESRRQRVFEFFESIDLT